MIVFRLNPSSGVPPYLQLAQQIRQALMAGVLVPGDQLPTVKEVVAQVAVNPNTVFKSYRELEREGLVQGRPGAGTLPTTPVSTDGESARVRRVVNRGPCARHD